ncbi:hypothetical protein KP509_18G068200 [Ceratopteris richardii]|uniref:Uncharacterized protein n=1 Tax=Ceratopteris richardii TaxID=49495 RepID=A0A8T2SV74_CERRI|nr:hypothetical protein KP509_18G068200 [Ceratopteris richardii]
MEMKDLPGTALAPGMQVERDPNDKRDVAWAANSPHQPQHAHMKMQKRGDERLERHSGTGIRGTPKKEGHGGKFTWSGPTHEDYILEEDYVSALDKNDPNYSDANEEALGSDRVVGVVDVAKVAGPQGVGRLDVDLD